MTDAQFLEWVISKTKNNSTCTLNVGYHTNQKVDPTWCCLDVSPKPLLCLIGPSWQACFLPPLALLPYMGMTSALRWSAFARTWACVHSTTFCLTSWAWRNTCGSTPDSRAWRKRTSARRWTSACRPAAFRLVWLIFRKRGWFVPSWYQGESVTHQLEPNLKPQNAKCCRSLKDHWGLVAEERKLSLNPTLKADFTRTILL